MTAMELAKQIQAVRDAQRRYFRTRDLADLEESRRLERELDRAVKEILDDQPAMFAFGDEGAVSDLAKRLEERAGRGFDSREGRELFREAAARIAELEAKAKRLSSLIDSYETIMRMDPEFAEE